MKQHSKRLRRRAFSLIELVIVIIILGVISAIAIPRMIRAGEGADVTGLLADLQVLRNAIELYRYEHEAFPDAASFPAQMTTMTNKSGATVASDGFGPYIVKIPSLKTGNNMGGAGVFDTTGVAPAEQADTTVGWLYDEDLGSIWANDADHLTD